MSLVTSVAWVDLAGGWLVQLMFAATALLLACGLLAMVARRSSAAVKHRIWSLGITALLPFLCMAPLLPQFGGTWFNGPVESHALPQPGAVRTPSSGHAVVHVSHPKPVQSDVRDLQRDQELSTTSQSPESSSISEHSSSVRSSSLPKLPLTREITAAPPISVQRGSWQFWWRCCVVTWLFGAAVGTFRWLMNQIAVRRLILLAEEVQQADILSIRDDVAAGLGMTASIPIRCSTEVVVPVATGVFNPLVLLPPGYGRWEPERLRMTLAHEMAHLARRDVLWQTVAQLVSCLYWPHPLVWLATWRMRVEREYASDDAVLAIGARPAEYAIHLVEVASALSKSNRPIPATVAIATRSEVETRVRAILKMDARRGPVGQRLGLCLLAITVVELLMAGVFRPTLANDPQTAKADAQKSQTTQAVTDDKQPTTSKQTKSESKAADDKKPNTPPVPQTQISGVVVDEADHAVKGITVISQSHRKAESTVTDADGRFSLPVPTALLPSVSLVTRLDESRRIAFAQLRDEHTDNLKLQLKPAQRAIVQVNAADGKPVSGAKASVLINWMTVFKQETNDKGAAEFWLPPGIPIHTVLAWMPGRGLDYRGYFSPQKFSTNQPQEAFDFSQPLVLTLSGVTPVRVTALDDETGSPIPGMPVYPWLLQKPGQEEDLNLSMFGPEFEVQTDAAGVATFDWMPNWVPDDYLFQFWPVTSDYPHERGNYRKAEGGGGLTMRLRKFVPIRGQVRLPDGKPAAGIRLSAAGRGYTHDDFRGNTTTDSEGRYEIKASADQIYLVVVDDPKWAAEPGTGFVLKPGQPREGLDFELRPATRLFGRVTMGAARTAVSEQQIHVYQYGQDLHNTPGLSLPNPKDSKTWIQPMFVRYTKTDKEGRYELFVGPGKYDIRGPSQVPIEKFDLRDETSREFNFHSPRAESGRFQGVVTFGDPERPAAKARVAGIYRHQSGVLDPESTTDDKGEFNFVRKLHDMTIHAQSADGSWARIVEVGADDDAVAIPLKPVVTVTGRLVDGTTKEAIAGRDIQYGVSVYMGEKGTAPFRTAFGGYIKTDAGGQFRIGKLAVGDTYHLSVVTNRDPDGNPRGWRGVGKVTPQDGVPEVDLGDVELKPDAKSPTLEDRIAEAFQKKQSAKARYQDSLRDIALGHLQLMLLLGDPQAECTKQFYKLRLEDREVRSAFDNYRLTALPISGDQAADTKSLAGELKITPPALNEFVIVVIDEHTKQLATVPFTDLSTNGAIDKAKVLALLKQHAPAPLDSQELLTAALAQAKRENKCVFVSEGATWCGPCWSLTRFMDKHKDVFSKDYIVIKLDHRWAHTEEIMTRLQNGKRGSIPWSVILDAEGKALSNSDGPEGNIGFPSSTEGISHFIQMLRHSRIRLTDEDLAGIQAALKP